MAPYGSSRVRALRPSWPLKLRPWRLPAVSTNKLPIDKAIDEECSPYYHPLHFYPARLWDVVNGRYQLASKLGYGDGSTVWLARDLNRFVSHVLGLTPANLCSDGARKMINTLQLRSMPLLIHIKETLLKLNGIS